MIAERFETHRPIPPIRREPLFEFHEGLRLRAIEAALRVHATGGMDVSDGLVGDLTKMCRAAKVSSTR